MSTVRRHSLPPGRKPLLFGRNGGHRMENPSLPHYHGEEPAHTEVVRQMLEKEDTFQELSDIFRQLGDANRIRIFWLLCHCEECVVNIAAMMDMSLPSPTTSASFGTAAC